MLVVIGDFRVWTKCGVGHGLGHWPKPWPTLWLTLWPASGQIFKHILSKTSVRVKRVSDIKSYPSNRGILKSHLHDFQRPREQYNANLTALRLETSYFLPSLTSFPAKQSTIAAG